MVLGYDYKVSPGPEGTCNLPAMQTGTNGLMIASAAGMKLLSSFQI